MDITEARNYINFGIREGYLDEEAYKDMTDKELIEQAEWLAARGDYEANRNEE